MRLLLFVDSRSITSVALARAALDRAAERPAITPVALVDAAPVPAQDAARRRLARALAAEAAVRVLEPRVGSLGPRRTLPRTSIAALGRRHGVPVVHPPGGDVNAAAFVERVTHELRPDAALTLVVAQRFGAPLLAALRAPVNYHDGLLPAYRGVHATAWSVHAGESRSGLTFHRMAAGIDDGPVLLQDAVAVRPRDLGPQVQRRKTRMAARWMGEVLDAIVRGEPGRPQDGASASPASRQADLRAAVFVDDPAALTASELARRLRAFETVHLRLAGELRPVTATAPAGGRRARSPLSFTTADGVRLVPTRIEHLPPPLHRLRRTVGARRPGRLR